MWENLPEPAQSNLPFSTMTPPRTMPWPLMNLVADSITMSAPWSRGLNRYGVAKVLSATRGTPWEWHISTRASMSMKLALGLLMVFTKTALVLSLIASLKASTGSNCVESTKVQSTLYDLRVWPK